MNTKTKTTETVLVAAEKVETKANPLRVVWLYLADHWTILLFGALAAVTFLYTEKFAEFAYSLLRFIIIVLASMALRDLWFKKTVRPYINALLFASDFAALPAIHKIWISVVIMVALLFAATLSFVHP